ncbi:MAG TPA: MFS transporter [Caulobacteraceae bacterium]|nr:MFS transporter [Caulobacteraceae bacterium]
MASRGEIVARLERLPPSRTIWTLVALISLGGAFEFYDLMMTAYISPVLVRAGVFHKVGLFGLPDQASFVAATFLGLFIGTIAVSQVADRFGRKRVFVVSLLWYTAAAVVMALQSTALGIDLWRLIAGVGIGVELVTVDTYIAELVPRQVRGRAFAVNQSIQFLAVPTVALAAWKLGPTTIAGIEGWRWVVLLGAVAAVGVWFIQLRLPESPRWLADHGLLERADAVVSRLEMQVSAEIGRPLSAVTMEAEPARPKGHLRDIFGPQLRGRTALLVVLNAFQAVGFYGFTNWAPTFLAAQGVHFAESLQYGFIIAAAYPIGPLVWSGIAERFERKWLVVLGAAGTGVLGLVFAASRAPAALIALGVAINFSNNLLSFSYHAYQAELYPTRVRATAVGFVYSWSRLSTVGSSYVIAWLLGVGGAPGAFGFIAAAMLVVMISVGLFGPPTRGRALEQIAH